MSKKFFVLTIFVFAITVNLNLSAAAKMLSRMEDLKQEAMDNRDKLDTEENNELMGAIQNGEIEKVNKLIKSGAYTKIWELIAPFALIAASGSGNRKMVEIFLNEDTLNSFAATIALDRAASSGCREIVELFLELKVYKDAISYALIGAFRHVDIIKLLINNGADLNFINEDGNTALIIAIWNNKKIVPLLINSGADLNITPDKKDMESALMKAIHCNAIDVVKLLLQAGADLNVVNIQGKTAMNLARERRDESLIKLLEDETLRRENLIKVRAKAAGQIIKEKLPIPASISNIVADMATSQFQDVPTIASSIEARRSSIVELVEGKRIPTEVAVLISKMAIEDYDDIPLCDREI